jgi:triacylglycerol lipase
MSHFSETPIVLVHGILGFDRLGLPGSPISYFRGVRKALSDAGYTVPEPKALAPAGSVKERAAELKDYLENDEAVKGQPVHIIAHSMGGLDSRYAISVLGVANPVLSLTTLGTPHRGTSIADLNVSVLGGLLKLLDSTHLVDLQGFFDLTRQHSLEFEQEGVVDSEDVRYFSVAGLYHPGPIDLFKHPIELLKPTHDFVFDKEGANDGLVPVTSATFGTFLGTWPGNHFRLINWPTNLLLGPPEEFIGDSVLSLYSGLVRHLELEMP